MRLTPPAQWPRRVSAKILAFLQRREMLGNNTQKVWLEALALLGKKDGIVALETGRIRNAAWRHCDGNSTSFLTRPAGVKKLVSILTTTPRTSPVCPGPPSSAASICRPKVELRDGNSVDVLNQLKLAPFDFVLLHSANDPELTHDQRAAVPPLVNPQERVLVIDEVHHPSHKGDRAIPWLARNGCEPVT